MHGISVIELGGEKRTVNFNLHFLVFLSKELKCNPDEVDLKVNEVCAISPLRGLTYVIYCGIIANFEDEFVFNHGITLPMVSKWVGAADMNEFTSIWEQFREVMGIPKASQEQIDAYTEKHAGDIKKKSKVKA